MICPVSSLADLTEQGRNSKIPPASRQALDGKEQRTPELENWCIFVSYALRVQLGQQKRRHLVSPHLHGGIIPSVTVINLDVPTLVAMREQIPHSDHHGVGDRRLVDLQNSQHVDETPVVLEIPCQIHRLAGAGW